MAKDNLPAGISAKLPELFKAAQPSDLSDRQWCLRAGMSTSFFTDLRNGREPGVDKVERMAGAIGLSLSEFVAGQSPPNRLVPGAEELEAMLSEIVADEVTMQTRPADLPRILSTALYAQLEHFRSGLVSPMRADAAISHGTSARSLAPTKRSAPTGSRTT